LPITRLELLPSRGNPTKKTSIGASLHCLVDSLALQTVLIVGLDVVNNGEKCEKASLIIFRQLVQHGEAAGRFRIFIRESYALVYEK
jgi:hypothetical protein